MLGFQKIIIIIVTFNHLGKAKIPSTATLSSKVKVSYKSSGVRGAGEDENSKCYKAGFKQKRRNYAPATGKTPELLSPGARPARPARPAAAVYPRWSVCLFVVLAARLGWCSGSRVEFGGARRRDARPWVGGGGCGLWRM